MVIGHLSLVKMTELYLGVEMETINVAEAKKHFSDILGRVFYGKEEITILRRNKAMAKLVPIDQEIKPHLVNAKGWLDNDDEFFTVITANTRHFSQFPWIEIENWLD